MAIRYPAEHFTCAKKRSLLSLSTLSLRARPCTGQNFPPAFPASPRGNPRRFLPSLSAVMYGPSLGDGVNRDNSAAVVYDIGSGLPTHSASGNIASSICRSSTSSQPRPGVRPETIYKYLLLCWILMTLPSNSQSLSADPQSGNAVNARQYVSHPPLIDLLPWGRLTGSSGPSTWLCPVVCLSCSAFYYPTPHSMQQLLLSPGSQV